MSIITPVTPAFLLVWLPDNNGPAWMRWWTWHAGFGWFGSTLFYLFSGEQRLFFPSIQSLPISCWKVERMESVIKVYDASQSFLQSHYQRNKESSSVLSWILNKALYYKMEVQQITCYGTVKYNCYALSLNVMACYVEMAQYQTI